MLEQSVVRKSGQGWKLVTALLALLIGSFAPLFAGSGVSWTVGTVIAIAGYAFGIVSIRCISCGNRWFWEAAMDAGLYPKIFRGSACLSCGHEFAQD
jgi:hypothetical protein